MVDRYGVSLVDQSQGIAGVISFSQPSVSGNVFCNEIEINLG